MSGGDDGFLGRWSRLKRQAERPEPEPEPEPVDPPAKPAPDAPVLTEEELAALPRIEDLVPGSDIRMFLKAGVPRDLRNAALRRMWMLTPAIRDHQDPAVDYAWDWNTPGGVPGDGVAPSAERAAQMLRDLMEPRPPAPPAEEVSEDPAPEDAPADATPEPPAAPGEGQVAGADPPAAEPAPRRRHGSALPG